MAKFLLVHGAMHGAWCWAKVVPLLQARGHEVVAIDLPGLGDDPTPPEKTSLSDYGDAVAKAARAMGGMAIGDGAEKAPDNIGKLVYLAALMVPPGETMASAGINLNIRVVVSENGLTTTITKDVGIRVFYNDCSDADIAFAMPRLKPQASSIIAVPMQLTPERYGSIPRVYIECTNDNAVDISIQRKMVWRLPAQQVITLDSGHSPFFSAPDKLADALDSLA